MRVAVLAVMLACGIASGCDERRQPALSPAEQNEAARPKPPPQTIDAEELLAAYDGNELAGDNRFKDRVLAVTGKVRGVEKVLGDIIVKLESKKQFIGVNVYLRDDQANHAAGLVRGQRVTFVGKCGGAMAVQGVKLVDAELRLP